MRRLTLVLLVGGLVSVGCAATLAPPSSVPAIPKLCWDGQPPRVFTNERCPSGLCGYTCEPNRWPVAPMAR